MRPQAPFRGVPLRGADPSTAGPVRWRCLPFAQVPPVALYRALGLRSRVFVVEQRCIYQDIDDIDLRALLVIASVPHRPIGNPPAGAEAEDDEDAEVVATARLLPPGVRFEEPSIGRVCTAPGYRRRGLGRRLMEYAIARSREHHPGPAIRISAQAYLQAFYESLGFETVSPPYLEDDIPHVQMRLRPLSPA